MVCSEVSLVVSVVTAVGLSGASSCFGPAFVQYFDFRFLRLLDLGLWAFVGDVLGRVLLSCVVDRLVGRSGVGLDLGLRVGVLPPLAGVGSLDAVGGFLDNRLLNGWLWNVNSSWRHFELCHP